MKKQLKYGDIILIGGQHIAKVDKVLSPGSEDSELYGCFKQGGYVLIYENGATVLHLMDDDHTIEIINN